MCLADFRWFLSRANERVKRMEQRWKYSVKEKWKDASMLSKRTEKHTQKRYLWPPHLCVDHDSLSSYWEGWRCHVTGDVTNHSSPLHFPIVWTVRVVISGTGSAHQDHHESGTFLLLLFLCCCCINFGRFWERGWWWLASTAAGCWSWLCPCCHRPGSRSWPTSSTRTKTVSSIQSKLMF